MNPKHMPGGTGRAGENAACTFLKDRGWRIVARNWHSPRGEIDIVALDPQDDIVAVEVKTRTSGIWTSYRAAELVSRWKAVKVSRTLADFLACHPGLLYHRPRVDVLCFVNGTVYYFRGISDEWN